MNDGGTIGITEIELQRRLGAEVDDDGCVQRGRRVATVDGDGPIGAISVPLMMARSTLPWRALSGRSRPGSRCR
ncbi:hypothetical protein I551_0486 [Mycobacterium ulcerans str. Harvey]|uniref:Uncharacterized protein n=1 Tax=Mycobacterium ulcerans str. Harvey TaxID=1299332 RepID=A0ABP3ARM3_MYCUL|nr:hypothetical protein I551_0486 [Mycobacterium ulcerans str. Harvey]